MHLKKHNRLFRVEINTVEEGKITCIIIDDESGARMLLKTVIERYFTELKVVGEGNDLISGIDAIKKQRPQLVFLDIEMPRFNGLQILKLLGEPLFFEIVFVTAYNQYAIEAIKLSAFDYLLKPIQKVELRETIRRFREKQSDQTGKYSVTNQQFKSLDNNLSTENTKTLIINTHEGTYSIPLDQIKYLEADGMYTLVHTNNRNYTISKPLKELEETLPSSFFRTHRSYLIHAAYLEDGKKRSSQNEVQLQGDIKIPLSRHRKKVFLDWLQTLT